MWLQIKDELTQTTRRHKGRGEASPLDDCGAPARLRGKRHAAPRPAASCFPLKQEELQMQENEQIAILFYHFVAISSQIS